MFVAQLTMGSELLDPDIAGRVLGKLFHPVWSPPGSDKLFGWSSPPRVLGINYRNIIEFLWGLGAALSNWATAIPAVYHVFYSVSEGVAAG
jgi:hypothetical protein